MNFKQVLLFIFCAAGETRTLTPMKALVPKTSVSANSTTAAYTTPILLQKKGAVQNSADGYGRH